MKTKQIKEEYLKLGSGTTKNLEFWLGVLSSSRQELLKEIAEKVEKYRRDKDFRRIPSGLKERVNDYQNGVNDTLDTVLSILSKMSEGEIKEKICEK